MKILPFILFTFFYSACSLKSFSQQSFIKQYGDTLDPAPIILTADSAIVVASGTGWAGYYSMPAIMKTDLNGSIMWQTNLTFPGDFFTPRSICQTYDHGFMLSGFTYHSSMGDVRDGGILKLDSAGNFMWAFKYAWGSMESPKKIIELPDSSFIVLETDWEYGLNRFDSLGNVMSNFNAGMTEDICLMDSDHLLMAGATVGQQHSTLTKWNFRNGNTEWSKEYSFDSASYATGISKTGDNRFLMRGKYLLGSTRSGAFLMLLDSSGNIIREKNFQAPDSTPVSIFFAGAIDSLNYLIWVSHTPANQGTSTYYTLFKLDTSLNIISRSTLNEPYSNFSHASIAITPGKHVVGAGIFGPDMELFLSSSDSEFAFACIPFYQSNVFCFADSVVVNSSNFQISGNSGMLFTSPMSATNLPPVLSPSNYCLADQSPQSDLFYPVQIFPNPFAEHVSIAFDKHGNETIRIAIFNTTGAEVCQFETLSTDQDLYLDFLPAGLYYIHITGSKINSGLKMLKN